MAKKATKKVKKRKVRIDSEGTAYVKATFNNIIVSVCNKSGQVISWSSAGKSGFRGSKKNTPYAAQIAATDAAKTANEAGMKSCVVYVKAQGQVEKRQLERFTKQEFQFTKLLM